MTTFDRLEPRFAELLHELAPAAVPDYFDDMLKATAGTRQRPAWTSLERLLPMQVSARLAPLGLPSWRPLVLLVVLAGLILALATTFLAGARPKLPPDGSRQLVIMVHNLTKAPVDLFVAEDSSPMGQEVGTAVPSTIPTMTGRPVVFTVPSGERWAIYVNPGPDGDGLISARDVPPDASGALPFTIWVDEGVEPIVVGPGGERLFGG